MSGDEWEPTKAQKTAIDKLARRDHFTNEEARRLIRFANTPRSRRDPSMLVPDTSESDGGPSNIDDISAGECKQIRGRMSNADRPAEVVDDYPDKHASVIFRHAQGRCNHSHSVGPTTSPRIDADECYDLRRSFAGGNTVEELLAEFHRSNNAATKHLFGRCDHDLSDYDRDYVNKPECDHMRHVYRENPNLTVPDIGEAFLVSIGAAHAHLTGDCSHERGEPPIDAQVDHRVTTDECDLMRRAYKQGESCDDLSRPHAFDLNYQTVVRHVFGRCVHYDNDEIAAENTGAGRPIDERDTVNKQDCAQMRRKYKRETNTSTKEIADRFGVGKGTLYYHVFGRCDHDGKREPPARNKRSDG